MVERICNFYTDTLLLGFNSFPPATKLYEKISVSKGVPIGLFLYRFYFHVIYFRVRSKNVMSTTNNIEFLALSKQNSIVSKNVLLGITFYIMQTLESKFLKFVSNGNLSPINKIKLFLDVHINRKKHNIKVEKF